MRVCLLAVVLGFVVSACSSTPVCSRTCTGCCDATGTCQTGRTTNQCGVNNNACVDCGAGKSCAGGQCVSGSGGGSGGSGGGGTTAGFTTTTLDSTQSDRSYHATAIDSTRTKIAVVYFVNIGLPGDGGTAPEWEIRYLEWNNGTVSTPQKVRVVQRPYGLAIAFQANGEPAVSYLGGGSDMSAFWFQSDAVVNYRSGGSTWTERVTAVGGDVPCGNPVSNSGFAVGLFPALGFDGATAYLAWRDVHNGQFPQQDWAGSDVKVSEGGPTAWTNKCVAIGGNNKQAYGGRITMVMANGQPAIAFDQAFGGADTTGQNVIFQQRKADGTWTAVKTVLNLANTQSGASLAYDATEGYGIAAVDRATDQLGYTKSADGNAWASLDPVFGSGSGGWFPSLAMDPVNHEPAIAYYICSARPGIAESNCLANEDELRVAQRIGGNWKEVLVDTEGGYLPKLSFLSTGKRAVVWRHPTKGSMHISVEK